jgi:sugar phosphate isomerase/epimerase
MSPLGIELLTVFGMPLVDHIQLAARLGCRHISTGLSNVPMRQLGVAEWTMFPDWSLEGDPVLQREVKAALHDNGIYIALGEGFRVRPDGDVRDRAAQLDLMAELGARRINAVSMETDIARTHDQLAILQAMVAERGMAFTIEFAPPNAINNLAAGLRAIDYVGRGKCSLLVDAMHFFRSDATVDELAALDPDLIGYAQLCDVPMAPQRDTYMAEAMFARLVPGDGKLPLAEFVAALPRDLDIGIEVPNLDAVLAAGSPAGIAEHAVAAARRITDLVKEAECPA